MLGWSAFAFYKHTREGLLRRNILRQNLDCDRTNCLLRIESSPVFIGQVVSWYSRVYHKNKATISTLFIKGRRTDCKRI